MRTKLAFLLLLVPALACGAVAVDDDARDAAPGAPDGGVAEASTPDAPSVPDAADAEGAAPVDAGPHSDCDAGERADRPEDASACRAIADSSPTLYCCPQ